MKRGKRRQRNEREINNKKNNQKQSKNRKHSFHSDRWQNPSGIKFLMTLFCSLFETLSGRSDFFCKLNETLSLSPAFFFIYISVKLFFAFVFISIEIMLRRKDSNKFIKSNLFVATQLLLVPTISFRFYRFHSTRTIHQTNKKKILGVVFACFHQSPQTYFPMGK